jgi:hypothetical protein
VTLESFDGNSLTCRAGRGDLSREREK